MNDITCNQQQNTACKGRILVLLLILVLILAVIGAAYCVVNRDRIGLEKYADRCGGSLKGLHYEIVDQYRQDAFQDPWMAWAIRIRSDPARTFYDTLAYQEGPLYSGNTNVAAAFAREMEAETGACFFATAAEPGCSYRVSSVKSGGWSLFAVYDPGKDLYYLFFDSFYL